MSNQQQVFNKILMLIPQAPPFRFIDEVIFVDDSQLIGAYTFKEDEFFYKGHFPSNPITPGVILTEVMAQIGLVAFGIYLINGFGNKLQEDIKMVFTSSQVNFIQAVLPGERVVVKSQKQYFRFKKLKCNTQMYNIKDELVCDGQLSGMIIENNK